MSNYFNSSQMDVAAIKRDGIETSGKKTYKSDFKKTKTKKKKKK